MTGSEPKRSVWPQRAAVAACGAVLFALWLVAQSERVFVNRVFDAGGYVNTEPTTPAWIRDRFGDGVAASFDTIFELGFSDEVPDGLTERAARVESLRWLVLNGSSATDADLVQFAGHPNLQIVLLRDTAVTDETLDVLAGLPRLERVSLGRTDVTAEGVAAFREARPEVAVDIDGTGMAGLGRFAREGSVSFNGSTLSFNGRVPPDFFPVAERLDFDGINLRELRTADEVVRLIAGRPLRRVNLSQINLTSQCAAALAACPLTDVSLSDMTLTAEAAQALSGISLDRLSLRRITFEAGAARALAGLRTSLLSVADVRLTAADDLGGLVADRLFLDRVDLADGGGALAGLTTDELLVHFMTLDAAATRTLAGIPSQRLTLASVHFHAGADAGLGAATARHVSLNNLRLSRDGVAFLAATPVERLGLHGVSTEEGAEAAFAGSKIVSLSLGPLSDAMAQAFAGSELRELTISSPITGDETLIHISRMPHLTRLDLCVGGVSDVGLAQLVALPELRELRLAFFPVNEFYSYPSNERSPSPEISPTGLRWFASKRPDVAIETWGNFDFRSKNGSVSLRVPPLIR